MLWRTLPASLMYSLTLGLFWLRWLVLIWLAVELWFHVSIEWTEKYPALPEHSKLEESSGRQAPALSHSVFLAASSPVQFVKEFKQWEN